MDISEKTIITTRPDNSFDKTGEILKRKGAKIISYPMIEINEANLNTNEKQIFENINNFDKIIFTSKNGVKYFFEKYHKSNKNKQLNSNIKFATIGKNTSQILEEYGYKTNFINKGNTSIDFIENIKDYVQNDENVLLAFGNLANNNIEDAIKKFTKVSRINVYNTEKTTHINKDIIEQIKEESYDLILFTSPSGFLSFKELHKEIDINKLKIACIGKITANSIKKYNITPLVVAQKSNAEGFAESIINYLFS